MSKQIVLPAVFTAIDKFSGPVNKMASTSSKSMARMERNFRKVGATAFDVSRKSAGVAAAVLGPMGLVANEAIKFEKSMANVSTLVDTNVESMAQMGDEVLALSKKLPVPIEELSASLFDVRSAGVSAADAMGTLESAGQLGAAGLATTQEATNILTSAMNSFKSEGLEATQIADLLFKTTKFGKTTIAELSQAFGSTAPIIQSAGVKLADFSAATSALTTTGTPASQAQNQLRASIISLQKPTSEMAKVFADLGVKSGTELIEKYGDLGSTFEAVNGSIEKLNVNSGKAWGSTEALAGVTALSTNVNEAYVATLDDMQNGTNALNGAFEKQSKTGAATMQTMKNNMQSLAIQIGNAVIPIINDLMKAITPMIQSFGKWISENKSTVKTIVKVAAVIGGLAAAISVVSGVVGLATKAFGIYKFAVNAISTVTKVITAIQWLWNAAMMANPIGAIIGAVALLTAGVVALTSAFSSQTDAERLSGEVRSRALENTLDLRVEVTQLFHTLRKAEKGSEAFNNTLARLEEIQPGIVDQFNLMEGKLKDLAAAEKALTANIIERAEAEARAELIKEKLKEAQKIRDEGPGFFDKFTEIASFGTVSADALNEFEARKLESDANILAQQQAEAELAKSNSGTVNPAATQTQTTNTNKTETNKVDINVNAPEGTTVSGTGGSGVKLSSTRKS